MTLSILDCRITNAALDPAQADLRLTVTLNAAPNATTNLRGRLMGPRCRYSSTIEIAYPLRPLPSSEANTLTCRIIIPEPSLWDPQSPFWYEGPVELWHEGALIQREMVFHGLRWLQPGASGLRINGRPLELHGKRITTATPEEMMTWRHQGINLLIAPATAENELIWSLADQLGFLMLGELAEGILAPRWREHPSTLGWVSQSGSGVTKIPLDLEGAPMTIGILP